MEWWWSSSSLSSPPPPSLSPPPQPSSFYSSPSSSSSSLTTPTTINNNNHNKKRGRKFFTVKPKTPPLPSQQQRGKKTIKKWLFPKKNKRNVTSAIDSIYLGKPVINDDKNLYKKKIKIISLTTYYDIIENIISLQKGINNNNNIKTKKSGGGFQYLKLTKSGTLTKTCFKNIQKFIMGICPRCCFSNCVFCCKKNQISLNYVTCFHCKNTFQTTIKNKTSTIKEIKGFKNKKCQILYENLFLEYLKYIKLRHLSNKKYHNNNNINSPQKIKYIFNSLNATSKKEIGGNYKALYYSMKIKKDDDGDEKIIPPFAFFVGINKPMSFFKKIVSSVIDIATIKTKYGSIISREKGGKASIFRTICCNRRYVLSARAVIVPRSHLMPHECILPHAIYIQLGAPKYVLCHRYPTLDLRSMTFHIVKYTWSYSCMAISTSIVSGNNADFDGDCLHIIPATTLITQAELFFLIHPKYNIITQDKLRVCFDHDERQTLYSLYGFKADQIHRAIFEMAIKEGSIKAYEFFCKLRKICHLTWESKMVSTITFKDFRDFLFPLYSSPPPPPSSSSSSHHHRPTYLHFIHSVYDKVPIHNGIREIIDSNASRFSLDHLWQIVGEISHKAKMCFLEGMDRGAFINTAVISRNNLINEVSLYGYATIKLTHCTKSVYIAYDGKVYTTDGILIASSFQDIL